MAPTPRTRLFGDGDRDFAAAVSSLVYANPFLPERLAFERAALGEAFDESRPDWNRRGLESADHPNVRRLLHAAVQCVDKARPTYLAGKGAQADRRLYEDVVLFILFHQFWQAIDTTIDKALNRDGKAGEVRYYDRFVERFGHYIGRAGGSTAAEQDPAHAFAAFFQVRRAFRNIFRELIGTSDVVVRLRSAVWQSIFTHDMRRYRRALTDRMSDVTTLITGPSGSGKELVARAIGLSRHIPFDASRNRFTEDFAESFIPLNISALPATLVESELFGHKRGSFTGAVADRTGWLEVCPPRGAVFLDEIGDLEPAIQVKLLRVLQQRTFQRLGEAGVRRFEGKIIAATNRDLSKAMRDGDFRADFYYRLCSDRVHTHTLREQLDDRPEDLDDLLLHLARRMLPGEADSLAAQTADWIGGNLPSDYAWPGNVRELEQCLRSVLLRNRYEPETVDATRPRQRLGDQFTEARLSAEEQLCRYCTLVYARAGSYEGAARVLGLDRRTVKAKIDKALLQELDGRPR